MRFIKAFNTYTYALPYHGISVSFHDPICCWISI